MDNKQKYQPKSNKGESELRLNWERMGRGSAWEVTTRTITTTKKPMLLQMA